MLKFLVYRVATIVPVLFGVSIVVFLMMKLIPGDPAEAILGPAATTEKIEMVRKSLGLDQPFYVQYFRWLWKVLQGDFGSSIAVNVPVAQLVWPKFWNTVLLTAGSLVICIVVGLGVGIVSGTRQYSWFDRISMSLTLIVANTPAFWLGLILMVVMALYLGWFPATGMYSMRASSEDLGDLIHHMVLPAITTASVSAAIIARLVRSSFLDVIRKHYITALRAKGLSERDIILRHGMKNALPPIINIVGPSGGLPDGRRALHGGGVLVAGDRAADLQLDRGAGPAGGPGRGPGDHLRVRAGESRHRHRRRGPGPPDPPGLRRVR